MPDRPARDDFYVGLIRRGFSAREVQRLREELGDHQAALESEALKNGASAAEAREYALQRLPLDDEFIGQLVAARRGRSWWLGHPALLFLVGPLSLLVFTFVGVAGVVALVGAVAGWWEGPGLMNEDTWFRGMMLVPLFHMTVILALPVVFCRLARRYHFAWSWAFAACALLAVHGYFHVLAVQLPQLGGDGQVTWGYGWSSDWGRPLWAAAPPLLIFFLHYVLGEMRKSRGLAKKGAI